MSEPTVRALTERLERLERQNRWLRRAGALLLCGLAVVVVTGQAATAGRALEAPRLVIRDADGKPLAVLGVVGDSSGLILYDRQGTGRASLSLGADDTARLRFFDRAGKARVSLDLTGAGASTAGFYDRSGKGRAQLQVAADGSPEIGFFGKDGKPIGPAKLFLPY